MELDYTISAGTSATINFARYTWRVDLFGNGFVVMEATDSQVPNWWRRMWARFFLGTKWTKK